MAPLLSKLNSALTLALVATLLILVLCAAPVKSDAVIGTHQKMPPRKTRSNKNGRSMFRRGVELGKMTVDSAEGFYDDSNNNPVPANYVPPRLTPLNNSLLFHPFPPLAQPSHIAKHKTKHHKISHKD